MLTLPITLYRLLILLLIFHFPITQAAKANNQSETNSAEAREKLMDLITGRLKPPVYGEHSPDAYDRYYHLRNKWLNALNKEDVTLLIDDSKKLRKHDDIVALAYIKYGKLNHTIALEQIGTTPDKITRKQRSKLLLIARIMQGWAETEPSKTWKYYLKYRDDFKRLELDNSQREILGAIFQHWSAKSPDQAFQALLSEVASEYFQYATEGYYYGLPTTINFNAESKKLEHLITTRKKRNQFIWHRVESGGAENEIRLSLAQKWFSNTPDDAINWLVSRSKKRITGQYKNWSADDQLRYDTWITNTLLKRIAQTTAENLPNHKNTINWIKTHPDFVDKGLVQVDVYRAVAKQSPHAAIVLIRSIKDLENRNRLLLALSSTRLVGGRFGSSTVSAVLKPDIIEKVLPTFHLNKNDLEKIKTAIMTSRQFEAKKPKYKASSWDSKINNQ